MRTLSLLLLVCFLVAVPVSAVSFNPASVGTAYTKNITTSHPVVSLKATLVPPPQTTLVPVKVPLSISSVPAGATIIWNGWETEYITPATFDVSTGTYTIRLSLNGYQDYSTTINLGPGEAGVINAQLTRLTVEKQNMTAIKAPEPKYVVNRSLISGAVAPLETYASCDVSPQKCLTLAEAAAMYAEWSYTEGSVCGYSSSGTNEAIPKYCCSGSPKQSAGPGTLGDLSTLSSGPNLRIENATYDVAGNLIPKTVATPRALGGQRPVGVIDSLLGFFSGLFSKETCSPGQTVCSGKCVNLTKDSANCGGCDYTCFDPAFCYAGECTSMSVR
jgi:hypothetical protein